MESPNSKAGDPGTTPGLHVGPLLLSERFELQRQIGTGGMSTIFCGHDRHTDRPVAIKVLSGRNLPEAERFRHEAQLLADLEHPAIVKYVAHGATPAGEHFLVMEWLDGLTLEDRLVHGPLTVSDSIALVRRVSDGLAAAHRRGIVHRDIKPSNLFLPNGQLGEVKLLDFGLARRVLDPRRQTQTGAIMGTPMYMAPEQARGESHIDGRADLFALGCVLFESLTGQPPFTGPTAMAVLAKICLDESLPIRELCPGLPAPLLLLLEQLLAKRPDQRPARAEDVLVALEARELEGGDDAEAATVALAHREARRAGTIRQTLTAGEQRVISVVLVTRPKPRLGAMSADLEEPGTRRTLVLPLGAPLLSEEEWRLLRADLEPLGARGERLLDGSIVVTLAGRGPPPDQAVVAARAALRIRARLPHTAVTISTGRAVIFGQLPVGAVIDRGAELLRDEPAGNIRLDETTAGLLDSRFVLDGESRRMLLGERELYDSPRTLLGRVTPFVGRARELAALEATFEECVEESVARAVLVIGPPGIGKSRLRHELIERLQPRARGFELLMGRGDVVRAGSPFGLIAPAIRAAAGIAAADLPEIRQRKLVSHVERHVRQDDSRRVTEFLGELVGVPFADEESAALRAAREDARLMSDQMRSAWIDWLDAECRAHPVLLVIEDLQWGDQPSLQLVDAALRLLADRPLLVVAFARPEIDERFPALWDDRNLQRLRLPPLTRKASEALVRGVLGPSLSEASAATPRARRPPDPQPVADQATSIVDKADGNPFFLEELIRAFADGSDGQLPETVLGMVQARLDAFGPAAKRVLRAASIFGLAFRAEGLAALLGDNDRSELPELIALLVAHEVFFPARAGVSGRSAARTISPTAVATTPPPELPPPSPASRWGGAASDELSFRHTLLREAAYASLTDGDRALGHRLAAEWLEKAADHEPLVLADHFERGGDLSRASVWYAAAATEALEANDLPQALAWAERGASCGATGSVLANLLLVQARAHFWRGEYADSERRALEALQNTTRGSAVWFHGVAELSAALGQQGQYVGVARWASLASSAIPSDGGSAQLACLIRAAGYLLPGGRYEACESLLARVETEVGGFHRLEPALAARAHAVRATRLVHSGDQAHAISLFELALEACEAAGDRRTACEMRTNVATMMADVGALNEAEILLRRAHAEAQEMALQFVVAHAIINLAAVLAYQGRLDEARRSARTALTAAQAQGDSRFQGGALLYLSTVDYLDGRFAESEANARAATQILAAPLQPSALASLSRALLAQGRTDEALRHACVAADLLGQAGHIEEYEALVRLMHAETLAATGSAEEARAALRTAYRRLVARAAQIRNERWRIGFLTRIPDHARTIAVARQWGLIDEPGAPALPAAELQEPAGRDIA